MPSSGKWVKVTNRLDSRNERSRECDDDPCDDVELEPSLCGVTVAAANMPGNLFGADSELEEGNDEPSLGSGAVGVYSTQSHWSQPGGGSDDREEDAGDDREEENEHCDGHAKSEPSQGWSEGMAQGQGRWGGTDDRELTAEPSAASVKTARKRHNHSSICDVTPIPGAVWKVE